MVAILIAPDKFKGSLTALQVGEALSAGLRSVRPDQDVDIAPVADGGDGTLAAAFAAGFQEIPVTVTGPTGDTVPTAYARRGDQAVVELADACGLSRLPAGRFAPLTASSRGVGEVIRAALDAGCRRIVLGVGGSASTDGGAGLVRALGARLLRVDGSDLAEGGAALADLDRIDLTALHPALATTEIRLACDVDNPLTGPYGAAAVYGPQKGATPDQVRQLDAALSRWADVLQADAADRRPPVDLRNLPGAGAAGGVAFAAAALLAARLTPGIDLIFDLIDFPGHLRRAALVVTGEGSLDEQTLHGKAPAGVARAAAAAGLPVVAVCGRRQLTEEQWQAAGFAAVYALSDLEPDPARSIRDAADLLFRVGVRLAHELPRFTDQGQPVG